MAREDNIFRRVNGFISIILYLLYLLCLLSIFCILEQSISVNIFVFFSLRLHISRILYIYSLPHFCNI